MSLSANHVEILQRLIDEEVTIIEHLLAEDEYDDPEERELDEIRLAELNEIQL